MWPKNNNILDDASGHGSHVSGTIAAVEIMEKARLELHQTPKL